MSWRWNNSTPSDSIFVGAASADSPINSLQLFHQVLLSSITANTPKVGLKLTYIPGGTIQNVRRDQLYNLPQAIPPHPVIRFAWTLLQRIARSFRYNSFSKDFGVASSETWLNSVWNEPVYSVTLSHVRRWQRICFPINIARFRDSIPIPIDGADSDVISLQLFHQTFCCSTSLKMTWLRLKQAYISAPQFIPSCKSRREHGWSSVTNNSSTGHSISMKHIPVVARPFIYNFSSHKFDVASL